MKIKKHNWWLIGAATFFGLAACVYIYHKMTEKYSPFSERQKEAAYIFIDSDDNIDSVCAKLRPYSSERSMNCLKKLMHDSEYERHILTGRYPIAPGRRIVDIYRMLKGGRQEPFMLTIPETRTMELLASRLSRKLMLDSASIARALTDSAFCQQQGYTVETIPCLFVPNTYEVYWDMSLDDLMKRMHKEYDAFWNNERKAKAEALGLTPDEVQTLASIVDEETANNAEKPTIAGLYLNRLKKGMLLQADPTVKFAMRDFTLKRILNKHLNTDSPYNTYKYAGLPPGPIRVASVQGIEAVLNAETHDYLYMCAKEDFSGTHNFAVTLQEHMRNARRYQQALNERGIK